MKVDLSKKVSLRCAPEIQFVRIVVGTSWMGGFRCRPDYQRVLKMLRALKERFGPHLIFDVGTMYGATLAYKYLGDAIRELALQETAIVIIKPGWFAVNAEKHAPGIRKDIFEFNEGKDGPWYLPDDWPYTIRYCQNRVQMELAIDQAIDALGEGVQAPIALLHDVHKPYHWLAEGNTPDLFLGGYQGETADKIIYDQLFPALAQKKSEGRIKAYGAALSGGEQIAALNKRFKCDLIMAANEISLMHHEPERLERMEELHSSGTDILIAAPFTAATVYQVKKNWLTACVLQVITKQIGVKNSCQSAKDAACIRPRYAYTSQISCRLT